MKLKKNLLELISKRDKFKFILCFDRGNSFDKASLYSLEENKYLFEMRRERIKLKELNFLKDETLIVLSSVGDELEGILEYTTLFPKDYLLGSELFPFKVNYAKTIGEDRLILSFYIANLSSEDALIIDSGTFTTVDFISKHSLRGGYILPGLSLLQETYAKGIKLGLPNLSLKKNTPLPTDTNTALEEGLKRSFFYPIESILNQYQNVKIFLTGRNGKLIKDFIKDKNIIYGENLMRDSLLYFAKEILNYEYTDRS